MNTINRFIRRHPLLRRQLDRLLHQRGQEMVSFIEPLFDRPATILDVGSGSGHITHCLRQQDYTVTPLDVFDYSLHGRNQPTLYDGGHMPFADDTFDLALILTTLHHARDVAQVVAETARVAQQIIIMEDVYKNRVHRHLTWWADNLFNLEFSGNPHNNKSDTGWRALFRRLDLQVVAVRQRWFMGIMWQLTYQLAPV